MLEAEMTQYFGYKPYERSETTNARNERKVTHGFFQILSYIFLYLVEQLKDFGKDF